MRNNKNQDHLPVTDIKSYQNNIKTRKKHKTIQLQCSQIYLNKNKKRKNSKNNKILRYIGNKSDREKIYKDDFNNFGLMKRLDQIQNRQNKYLRAAKSSLQIQKQYKKTHQAGRSAQIRLKTQSLNQQNQKLIDLLVERSKYKKINSFFNKSTQKCVRLQESRMKMKQGFRSFILPPMNFK